MACRPVGYIDLNQVRAGEAETPEESTHTSAYDRIQGARLRREAADKLASAGGDDQSSDGRPRTVSSAAVVDAMPPDGWLAELTLREGPDADVRRGLESSTPWRLTDKGMLPIELDDYLSLLDWTGRRKVSGKSGSIPDHLAPILERLSIRPQRWLESVENFEKWFGRVVGRAENLARHVARSGRRWIRGAGRCADVFT